MKFSLYLILMLFSVVTVAQDDSKGVIDLPKEVQKKMEFAGVFKSSIGIEFAGKSGLVGVNYDLLLSRHVRLGMGLGYAGAGMDLKFFPIGGVKRGKLRFTAGLRANYMEFPEQDHKLFLSAPLGLFYAGVNRINYEFDIGPLHQQVYPQTGSVEGFSDQFQYVWFSLKLSYRFSFYAMKRYRQFDKNK
ncbi:hypothetical protein OAV92_02100 [Crocinitomicaceae bacterium]|nr:hypothetical protein [Crocinitomicaceae bacterium]